MAAARKVLHLRRMAKGRPMNGVAVSMPAPAYWKPRPVAACAGLQYFAFNAAGKQCSLTLRCLLLYYCADAPHVSSFRSSLFIRKKYEVRGGATAVALTELRIQWPFGRADYAHSHYASIMADVQITH